MLSDEIVLRHVCIHPNSHMVTQRLIAFCAKNTYLLTIKEWFLMLVSIQEESDLPKATMERGPPRCDCKMHVRDPDNYRINRNGKVCDDPIHCHTRALIKPPWTGNPKFTGWIPLEVLRQAIDWRVHLHNVSSVLYELSQLLSKSEWESSPQEWMGSFTLAGLTKYLH